MCMWLLFFFFEIQHYINNLIPSWKFVYFATSSTRLSLLRHLDHPICEFETGQLTQTSRIKTNPRWSMYCSVSCSRSSSDMDENTWSMQPWNKRCPQHQDEASPKKFSSCNSFWGYILFSELVFCHFMTLCGWKLFCIRTRNLEGVLFRIV